MRRIAYTHVIASSFVVLSCGGQADSVTAPGLVPTAAVTAAAPPAPNVTAVTSTVYDADGSADLLLTRSDDFNGTGFATYTTSSKVTSHITADGSWQLYLGSQTTRKLYLVLASQGIPAPDGYYSSNVEAFSQCFDQNNSRVSVLLMSAGSSNANCSFGVDFSSGRTKYKLVMSPSFGGTGRAIVTCNSASNGTCTSWTIVPNTGVANAGVANLYRFAKNGSLVFDGAFQNSYFVTAAQ